ncbi:hypothetical protein CHS0354_042267 [Potamilus streckersoni]|uniref:Peptidase S1 domain-containing protein n=1 Tax=Potamilus streckersoni TaxID=2493646 RepID=A0AAE0SUH1_9BIVA|nr:hypothetical protein CHS0354_042267 [Potamilus streckersoni]
MSGDYWTVAIGVHDMAQMYSSNIHRTSVISVHGNYDSQTNENDIAMMKLDRPVDLSGMNVRSACLPRETDDFTDRVCTVTGWGSTHSGGSATRYMLEVDVPIISNNMCEYYLGRGSVHDSNICAGYTQGGKDACQVNTLCPELEVVSFSIVTFWKETLVVRWSARWETPGLWQALFPGVMGVVKETPPGCTPVWLHSLAGSTTSKADTRDTFQ